MRYEKRTNMGLKLSLRQGMHIQTHPPFVVAFTRWHSRMNACTRTCCRPVPLTNRFSRKRHSQWNVRCRRSVFQRIDCGRIFAKPKRDVLRPWSSNANNATNGKATLPWRRERTREGSRKCMRNLSFLYGYFHFRNPLKHLSTTSCRMIKASFAKYAHALRNCRGSWKAFRLVQGTRRDYYAP